MNARRRRGIPRVPAEDPDFSRAPEAMIARADVAVFVLVFSNKDEDNHCDLLRCSPMVRVCYSWPPYRISRKRRRLRFKEPTKLEGWVAVTHSDWFDFLAQQPRREEVNFWSPSDYYAFHGSPGAPFFFKLKAPRNAIGGFGYVASFSRLPEWLAWECFGEGNGAPSLDDLRGRLGALRDRNALRGAGGPSQIGCIVLVQVAFFPRDQWISQPTDWAARNLRYKKYDLSEGEGARVWTECLERAAALEAVRSPLMVRESSPRYGEPVLVRPRLGQGAFRVAVTDAYQRACAVTGEHSLPVLEAAHIRPYSQGGAHEVRNGLLLRSDLHRLFDLGYVTVTPDLRLAVSPRLRGEYENGRTYYPMHGGQITAPVAAMARPDPDLLRWHNDAVFRG